MRSWLTVATLGQLRVVLVGAVGRPPGDDADLIQRQPALAQARGAARELVEPVRDGGDGSAFADDVPVFQATNAGIDRAPVAPQSSSRSISATMSTMRPSMALR